jgi:tetratricopeptide (TPR) repeat protein
MARESQRDRIARCLKAVEENPSSAVAHHNLGLAYTRSGRVRQAEEAYVKAVELDPSLTEAWVNLGGVRLMHWDFEGCLEATQAAARLDDTLVEVHFNMGQAHLYLNDPENLLSSMKRVLELDRDHAAGHYFTAVASLALGELAVAERHLSRASELGHQPPQDFVKAMEKARSSLARKSKKLSMIEITGAEVPDKTKED